MQDNPRYEDVVCEVAACWPSAPRRRRRADPQTLALIPASASVPANHAA